MLLLSNPGLAHISEESFPLELKLAEGAGTSPCSMRGRTVVRLPAECIDSGKVLFFSLRGTVWSFRCAEPCCLIATRYGKTAVVTGKAVDPAIIPNPDKFRLLRWR